MRALALARRLGRCDRRSGRADRLAAKYNGAAGRAFVAALPGRAARFLERWELRLTAPPCTGWALVLPVCAGRRPPGRAEAPVLDEESAGEPVALRVWARRVRER